MKITTNVLGHTLLFFVVLWFCYSLLKPYPWIFLDNLNLLVHEAGHLLFRAFGQFMGVLGGSVFQIIVPCLFLGYFYFQEQFFALFFVLFWTADSVINVSVYIRDAQVMALPLVGGDGAFHDWNWLLTRSHLLSSSQLIGGIVYGFGLLMLLFSVLGMGYWIFRESRV